MPDPIHQFEIHTLVPIKLFGWDVSFTNSSLFMLVAVLLIASFYILSMRARSLVPTRLQSVAEISHEFVAGMLRDSTGHGGMKYFPFVFSLFIFIFAANMLGMIPGAFTVTSHIVVTAALAALVFLTVLVGRLRQERRALPQAVRAAGRADPDPAAGGGDRDHLVPVAPDQPFGAPVRQHAGRPHHAQGVRRLRRHAARRRRHLLAGWRRCRWPWPWR